MNKYVFVDFDGTLYNGDSMLDYAIYKNSTIKLLFKSISTPILLILSGKRKKERFLNTYLNRSIVGKKDYGFFDAVGLRKIDTSLLSKLRELSMDGWEVVIVTASAYEWVKPYAKAMGMKLIATKLNEKNGRIAIKGENCKGAEKVRRIKEKFSLTPVDQVIVYGDDDADDQMGQLATSGYYKKIKGAFVEI